MALTDTLVLPLQPIRKLKLDEYMCQWAHLDDHVLVNAVYRSHT